MKNEIATVCERLIDDYTSGIRWLEENLPEEKKLASIVELARLAKELGRLHNAALTRPTIAIFGQSQVGKSYLTSNLVKSPSLTDLLINDPVTGQSISFIKEMNPYGGKESTGTVTRFTTAPNIKEIKGYAVRLLSPKDLVCIIVNGYYLDIIKHSLPFSVDDLDSQFSDLSRSASQQPTGILHKEDLYEIRRYMTKNLSLGTNIVVRQLEDYGFWDMAADLAPYLSPQGVTLLCENLWGKQPFLSHLFQHLLAGLQQMAFSSTVWVEKAALTPNDATILDVERVRELYTESGVAPSLVRVTLPSGQTANVDRRVLAALTAEVEIPLPEQTSQVGTRQFLAYADVLDFPGARSREHIPEEVFVSNTNEAKLQLFIRGKVAYLFDLYNQDYGISTLLFCMHEDNPEVQNIPSLLKDWISNIIGTDANERNVRIQNVKKLLEGKSDIEDISPLLVVLTKADVELSGKSSEIPGKPDSHDGKWVARIEENFKNFMVRPLNDKWVVDWTTDKSQFNHVFPLRNPDFSRAIFDADASGMETAINGRYAQKLMDMKISFLAHKSVRSHIMNPEETWLEFASPEKTGIDYIARYLAPTCRPEVKLELVSGAIARVNKQAFLLLDGFHNSEDKTEILRKAKTNGAKAVLHLTQLASHNNSFGLLLQQMLISVDEAWACYNNLQNAPVFRKEQISGIAAESIQLPVTLAGLFASLGVNVDGSTDDILKALQDQLGLSVEEIELLVQEELGISVQDIFNRSVIAEVQAKHPAMIFTERLMGRWQSRLQDLKASLETILGIPLSDKQKESLFMIVEELVKAKDRQGLKIQIYEAVKDEVENFTVNNKVDIVARISQQMLNNFVNTFGFYFVHEADRPKDANGIPLFGKREYSLDELEPNFEESFPGEAGIFNPWRLAAKHAIESNALAEANIQNVSAIAANRELGQIINQIKGAMNAR